MMRSSRRGFFGLAGAAALAPVVPAAPAPVISPTPIGQTFFFNITCPDSAAFRKSMSKATSQIIAAVARGRRNS